MTSFGAVRRMGQACSVALAVALSGCGSTIGDACTTPSECGSTALCLNQSFTPGGYCSKTCAQPADCPNGTTCVADGAAQGNAACFRLCTSSGDCRTGYSCLPANRDGPTVCVASPGF